MSESPLWDLVLILTDLALVVMLCLIILGMIFFPIIALKEIIKDKRRDKDARRLREEYRKKRFSE